MEVKVQVYEFIFEVSCHPWEQIIGYTIGIEDSRNVRKPDMCSSWYKWNAAIVESGSLYHAFLITSELHCPLASLSIESFLSHQMLKCRLCLLLTPNFFTLAFVPEKN